jgi:glycosyltransferase involved in cell wall biosynthesis
MKKILIVCPYPFGQAPSQRFRFEQYLEVLTNNGFQYEISPFMSLPTWKILYKNGHAFQKIAGILAGFLKRILLIFKALKYNFIFIHREATPLGFPFFEWIVAKVFRKKIIFDFDDSIWLSNTSQSNKIVGILKFHQKTALICKWAYKISAGNAYLADYAQQFNPNVTLNPTTIDTETLHISIQKNTHFPENQKVTIGWTGTHSTLFYLEEIIKIIRILETKYNFQFLVIANQNPDFQIDSFIFKPWNKETEIQDLAQIDIGIMPLTDDEWAKGKCGFKALQYMALGIPAVASPVGVNSQIIDNEDNDLQNGFLCKTPDEWEKALVKLLEDSTFREKLGKNARNKVVKHFSVLSNQENFLSLFL